MSRVWQKRFPPKSLGPRSQKRPMSALPQTRDLDANLGRRCTSVVRGVVSWCRQQSPSFMTRHERNACHPGRCRLSGFISCPPASRSWLMTRSETPDRLLRQLFCIRITYENHSVGNSSSRNHIAIIAAAVKPCKVAKIDPNILLQFYNSTSNGL